MAFAGEGEMTTKALIRLQSWHGDLLWLSGTATSERVSDVCWCQVLNPERQPQVVRHDSQNAGKDCAEESAETLVALTS